MAVSFCHIPYTRSIHIGTYIPIALMKMKFTNLVESVPDDFNVEFVQVCLTDAVLN